MADKYWKIIEPIWGDVSIYDSPKDFIDQYAQLNEKQKVLLASHWTQSEIMNGGLGQFFSNPTGILAPEAVWAFEQLRMPECASILAKAMKFFGDEYPRLRSVRESHFESFNKLNGDNAIPLLEEEDDMATQIEDENGGFWYIAELYAKKINKNGWQDYGGAQEFPLARRYVSETNIETFQ
jgi:hypothetical protein